MPVAPPPIAIGLPVYNGGRYLAQTLADLLGQTFGDFDLVVCDNASTDDTEAIAREAASRDRRVRYFRHARNLGALPNANFAFAQSRSPRFVLGSHDDRRHPAFLERLSAALDAHPDAVLAHPGTTLIDADDVPMRFDPAAARYTDAAGRVYAYDRGLDRDLGHRPSRRFAAVLRASDINGAIHGLFRADAYARFGPMDVRGADRLLLARAALAGPWAFVDAPLFGYRLHAGSTFLLTREAWWRRETGREAGPEALALAQTYARYARAPWQASLPLRERLPAMASAMGVMFKGRILQRLFLPGPDSYWGWKNRAVPDDAMSGTTYASDTETPPYGAAAWEWLDEKHYEHLERRAS